MKKLSAILLSSAVLALAGCGNQGNSSDPYTTDYGTTSNTNYNRQSVTNDYQGSARSPGRTNYGTNSNTNYNQRSVTDDYQGSARTPGRTNTGTGYSTNYPGTNDQILTIDPARTNRVPQN